MSFLTLSNRIKLVYALGGCFLAENIFAQEKSPTEQAYFEENTEQPETFNSIPVSHITPQLKKVSLAIDSKYVDTKVTNQSVAVYNTTDQLQMKGYTVSPFIALTLSRLGLGINFESGKRELLTDYVSSSFTKLKESKMDYSGLGVYFYMIPFQQAGSWKLSMVLGSKLLNAKHQTATSQSGSTLNSGKTDYSVVKTNVGMNLRYHMSPKIAVIPWVDYLQIDVNRDSKTDSTIYDDDIDLFWIERPEVLYGMDVTYRVGQAELHLGGAITLLNSIGQKTVDSQTYKFDDKKSLNISLSYDFKD